MTAATYTLRATYRGQRVDVVQALEGANWAILLDGVPVSVSAQSLSDFRSERDPEPEPVEEPTPVDRAPARGWEHFDSAVQVGYRVRRDDTVSVTLAARSVMFDREAFVQHAYPLEAADVAWLRDRLAEAHGSMTGGTPRTPDGVDGVVLVDTLRRVEDCLDAHERPHAGSVLDADTARGLVAVFLDAGWTPPTAVTP